MSPCCLGGSPPLQSGGHNHRWPTSGLCGYNTSCPFGGAHRFRVGGIIKTGSQVGLVGTRPLTSGGSRPLQSGAQNQRWPTSGPGGYNTPAAYGVPTVSQWGVDIEVAHKWAT